MGVEDFAGNQASFAARYASMSDAELLELAAKSWELSDAAWEMLEDELDRRGLELPTPEEVPQVAAPEKRNLVLLRRFRDLPKRCLLKDDWSRLVFHAFSLTRIWFGWTGSFRTCWEASSSWWIPRTLRKRLGC